MHIGDQTCLIETQPAVLIEILFIHGDLHDLCDKQIMGPQIFDLCDNALQTHRALPDGRRAHGARRHFRQFQMRKLINIPAGTDSTEIRGAGELLRCEIDDKFPCLGDDPVGISLGPYRDRNHDRITADRAGPGCCHDVAPPLFIRAADHNSRHRIEQIGRPPVLSCHAFLISAGLCPQLLKPDCFFKNALKQLKKRTETTYKLTEITYKQHL